MKKFKNQKIQTQKDAHFKLFPFKCLSKLRNDLCLACSFIFGMFVEILNEIESPANEFSGETSNFSGQRLSRVGDLNQHTQPQYVSEPTKMCRKLFANILFIAPLFSKWLKALHKEP